MWNLGSQVGAWCSIASFVAMMIIEVRRRGIRRQRQLIEAAPAKDRPRLLEGVLGRFAIDTAKLTAPQQSRIAMEMLRQRSERFRWGLIATTGLLVLSLGTVLAASSLRPAVYQIRVTILGLDGQPTDDTELRSSVDGVLKQLSNGWELEISEAKRSPGGHITIWAKKGSLRSPPVEVELGSDYKLSIELQMERVEAQVRGLVVDESNEAIAGARVFVVGFEEDANSSGPSGSFVLNAHAATGERVRLRAEKDGYQTRDQTHLAGRAPVTLILEEEYSH